MIVKLHFLFLFQILIMQETKTKQMQHLYRTTSYFNVSCVHETAAINQQKTDNVHQEEDAKQRTRNLHNITRKRTRRLAHLQQDNLRNFGKPRNSIRF